jgi:hypothetical protein
MPQIKYIGKKEFFPDFVAQSGKSWNGYGDVQEVTDDQAKKLLVHDDEFAEQGAHDALLIEQAQEAANLAQIPAPDNGVPQPENPGVPESAGLADAAPKQASGVSADEISAMNKVELTDLASANSIGINPAAPVAALRKQLIAALITA